MLFRRSRCCLPIPGDDVIGYVTRGTGHGAAPPRMPEPAALSENEPDRCTRVEYVGNDGQVYQVFLIIECLDRMNLLADVGNMFGENKTNITAVKTQSHRGQDRDAGTRHRGAQHRAPRPS